MIPYEVLVGAQKSIENPAMAIDNLHILLLIGGQSTRMKGSPKHLLPFPQKYSSPNTLNYASGPTEAPTIPLYIHLVSLLKVTCGPDVPVVISIRDSQQGEDLQCQPCPVPFEIVKDEDANLPGDAHVEGPAAGLLAAHEKFPLAKFIVMACDFPLMTQPAIFQLTDHHYLNERAACFVNSEGYLEPLAAVWTPYALQELRRSVVEMKQTGPSWTLRRIGAQTLVPESPNCLHSANTPKEWNDTVTWLENTTNVRSILYGP